MENLKLNGFKSKNIFELKLKALKTLNIDQCEKIYINEDVGLSIRKLILPVYNISKSLLKLPQLEYLKLSELFDDSFPSIDFNSLNNLKKIKVWSHSRFPQILSIKNLKEIDFSSDNLMALSILPGKNPSVNKLIYKYIFDYEDSIWSIDNILNKFPNLTELIFIKDLSSFRRQKNGWVLEDHSEINLEIKENSNCKINKIALFLYLGDIQVECQNFENLEKLEIDAYKILNISESNCIPMLSDNRNIIYNSLTEFKLHIRSQLINLEIFKNLDNSIDNMPNLKKIELLFSTNIERNTYEEFIKKILSLKLEFININFDFYDENIKKIIDNYYDDNGDYYVYEDDYGDNPHNSFNMNPHYSYEELKIINKGKLNLNYENIKIKKYRKLIIRIS